MQQNFSILVCSYQESTGQMLEKNDFWTLHTDISALSCTTALLTILYQRLIFKSIFMHKKWVQILWINHTLINISLYKLFYKFIQPDQKQNQYLCALNHHLTFGYWKKNNLVQGRVPPAPLVARHQVTK